MLNFLKSILKNGKQTRKPIADYKQEILIKQGSEQIKMLIKKGLSIPVVLL